MSTLFKKETYSESEAASETPSGSEPAMLRSQGRLSKKGLLPSLKYCFSFDRS